MRLWHLKLTGAQVEAGGMTWKPGDAPGSNHAFVIMAADEASARQLATAYSKAENEDRSQPGEFIGVWLDPSLSTCSELTETEDGPGFVMADYRP